MIPFAFGRAVTGDNFTDREKETKRLAANFNYGINTILISPRRWGKTSLVKKVMKMVGSKDLRMVYIDIFACKTPEEFFTRFAESVVKQTSSKTEEWIETIKNFLMRFNPKISLKDPQNEISLSLQFLPKQEDYKEILQLPEKIAKNKNCRIVICIDEFQQIGEFKDSLVFQKQLREIWQHQEFTSYCLFGSKKHLMTELFEKPSYPFYKFGDTIFLDKIPSSVWIKFIREKFTATNKYISEESAQLICELTENQSNYVQQLSWICWVNSDAETTREVVLDSYQEMIDHNSHLYEKMTENLTAFQMNFLKALLDGVNREFTYSENLIRYQLGSSANVSRIKEALLKKDIIDIRKDKVAIPDPIFREWLRKELTI